MHKITVWSLLAAISLVAISGNVAARAEGLVLDQVSDNIVLDNPDWSNATGCSSNPMMIFQPGITGLLESIDLPIRSYDGRVGGFNIDILTYNETTNAVEDAEPLASQSAEVSSVVDDSGSFAWASFNIDAKPKLTANKKYVIRLFAGFDGNCDAGYSWAMRKYDAPNFERGNEVGFDSDDQVWKNFDNDFGFKTYMTASATDDEVDPKPISKPVKPSSKSVKPSISFFLSAGQKSLGGGDLARLKKLLSKTSKNSSAVCLAANYGYTPKSAIYSLSLAKSVCGSLKKTKSEISRSLKVSNSTTFGRAAKGAKWKTGSYRVDIVITKN